MRGQVQYRGASFALVLNSADDLRIYRTEAVALPISEIAFADSDDFVNGNRVRVNGTVDEWTEYTYSISLWIRDSNGYSVNVWIPRSVIDLTGMGVIGRMYEGMNITVEGALKWYEAGRYSRWEIIPASSEDITEVRQ